MTVKRQPDLTRQRLIEAAFEEIHRSGFRSASLESILRDTNVTKGALYHHFRNKTELGYAVVEEVLRPWVVQRWQPMLDAHDPIDVALEILNKRLSETTDATIILGCPLNNLCQEMAGLDEGFQQRLNSIVSEWRDGIAEAMRRGQKNGTVRADADPIGCAAFVVGSIEGCMGMAKAAQDMDILTKGMGGLAQFLESLRPPHSTH